MKAIADRDYEALLAFRTGLRRFLHWSEEQSAEVGLTPAQHQLLLAIRGLGGGPTIGAVADELLLKHHSTVGLVDRAADADLVERRVDPDDHRVVRVHLTAAGARKLRQLSELHLAELARLKPLAQVLV